MTPLDPATPAGERAERELAAVLAGVLQRLDREGHNPTTPPPSRQERTA